MVFSVKEAIDKYKENSVGKTQLTTSRLMAKSILAGLMIGMGAAGSSVAAHSVGNVGLGRLAAAVVFPVGLMMILLLGGELFTGDCLMVMALPEKKISAAACIRTLVGVYIGNFIGATLLAFLVYYSGQLDYSQGLLGAYTMKVAIGKTSLSFGKALISGICCNILVCAAVLMAGCAKDAAGKLLVSFFVIMLFVTSGYEHCVANMYYITAGMLTRLNPTYVRAAMENYGMSSEQLANLNILAYFVKNLLPVTIGNIIGGAICFGLPLYYMNKDVTGEKKKKEAKTNGQYFGDYITDTAV